MQAAQAPKTSVFEENSVAVAKVAALITAVMTAIWAIVMIVLGSEWLTHSALTSMGGAMIGWALMHYGHTMWGRHFYMLSGIVGLAMASVAMPPSANMNMILFALLGGAFLMFQGRRKFRYAVFYSLLTACAWAATEVLNGKLTPDYEVSHELADLIIRPFTSVSLLILVGGLIGYFAYTVLVRTEDMMIANNKAEAANHAKSKFLATMSHELRTPMNGVVGMIELMDREETDAEKKEKFKTVRESAFSLLGIIDDILDTSKMEAGKLSLSSSPTDVRSHVTAVVASLRPIAEKAGTYINLTISDDVPEFVKVDPMRLRQILVNIIGNAIKFSKRADGSVGEEVKVAVGRSPEDDTLYCVTDYGVGMDEKTLANLFQPFTQSDAEENRRFGGTGLGLSIAKGLAELMGGSITVKSKLNEGSSFTVSLPLKVEDVAPEPEKHESVDTSHLADTKAHILLVEDNVTNQLVISQQLKALGLTCDTADNGIEGLKKWQAGGYDLVLSDCHIPEMDGFEMTHHIRRKEDEHKLVRTPVVAVTANALSGEAERCIAMDMDDYIAKPVRLDVLAETLSRWLVVA
jgi:signal transduction histidine kinase/ActR/RegA family two-component response regulator